jgi:hypothetical protein
VGYFDANQAASVVQCIKKSVVVSAPVSAGTGNWDCNIFSLPFLGSVNAPNFTGQGVAAGSGLMAAIYGQSTQSTMGPVTIIAGAAGSDLSLSTHGTDVVADGDSLAAANANYAAAPQNGFLDGNSRLIGMGFEVHNTTAELYRQGAVAVYHQPQNMLLDRSNRTDFVYTGTLAAPLTWEFSLGLTTQTITDAPSNLASAMLLSGSRQWEAKDGVMCIPTLISNDIPTVRRESVVPVVVNTTKDVLSSFAGLAPGAEVRFFPAAIPSRTRLPSSPLIPSKGLADVCYKPNKFTNFNTVGSFFSGLSTQTTLVVNVIYYIERFPSPSELDLVVMAQPSPASDPIAAELYSILMREMPPGVKVADNADGDWFYELISGAAKFLQPALAAAGPLGIAASTIASGADSWAQGKLREGKKPPNKQGAKKQQNKILPRKPNSDKPKSAKKKTTVNTGSTWVDRG